MENIQKNKNVIIAIVVILIFNIGLIFGLAKPLHKKVLNQRDEVEQAKYKLEDIKKEGEKWQEYKSQREKFESNKELVDNSSVSDNLQIKLIERLEQIARDENIIIEIQSEDVKIDDKKSDSTEKESGSGEEITFSLTLDGEYNEILDYLFKLENLNYVLNISSIEIKTQSKKPTLRNQIEDKEKAENQKSLQAKIIISFIPKK